MVASYVADGVSLVASGKTITDHALSAAVAEDCAMWRVTRGEAICFTIESDTFEGPDGEALLAEVPGDDRRDFGPTSWRADQPDAVRWGPRD
ncbi:MAG: hypothetical protein ACTS3R_16095 [Inquilinaceae bacterium]